MEKSAESFLMTVLAGAFLMIEAQYILPIGLKDGPVVFAVVSGTILTMLILSDCGGRLHVSPP